MAQHSNIAPGYTVTRDQIADYIRRAAVARGIDPAIALEVYRREGAGGWNSGVFRADGSQEPSYGPFQLYTGGGLGNVFQRQTGLDPRDPSTWQANIDFALDQARANGWGPWYGARAAGITGFRGIDRNAPQQQLAMLPQMPAAPGVPLPFARPVTADMEHAAPLPAAPVEPVQTAALPAILPAQVASGAPVNVTVDKAPDDFGGADLSSVASGLSSIFAGAAKHDNQFLAQQSAAIDAQNRQNNAEARAVMANAVSRLGRTTQGSPMTLAMLPQQTLKPMAPTPRAADILASLFGGQVG